MKMTEWKGTIMKPVNIEQDEKAVDAARLISQYCADHPNCKQCVFTFSQVCMLKWTKAEHWNDCIIRLFDHRKSVCTDKEK